MQTDCATSREPTTTAQQHWTQRLQPPRRMKRRYILLDAPGPRASAARTDPAARGLTPQLLGGDFDEVSTGDARAKAGGRTRGPTLRSRTTASHVVLGAAVAAVAVVALAAVAVEMNKRTCGASANKDIGTRSWRTMLTSSFMVSRRCWRP